MFKRDVLFLSIMMFMFMACATTPGSKPLTAKQQAAVWMTVYNSQYDDTMAMAKSPLSTPAQKEMVAKKKAILTKVWPLLKAFSAIVDSGGTPTAAQGADITNLINELTALVGG